MVKVVVEWRESVARSRQSRAHSRGTKGPFVLEIVIRVSGDGDGDADDSVFAASLGVVVGGEW
jgi:hypothetical protein